MTILSTKLTSTDHPLYQTLFLQEEETVILVEASYDHPLYETGGVDLPPPPPTKIRLTGGGTMSSNEA